MISAIIRMLVYGFIGTLASLIATYVWGMMDPDPTIQGAYVAAWILFVGPISAVVSSLAGLYVSLSRKTKP